MRAVVELISYGLGLMTSLIVAAMAAVRVGQVFGVSPTVILPVLPFLEAAAFVGFHKSFDYVLELYAERHEILAARRRQDLSGRPATVRITIR